MENLIKIDDLGVPPFLGKPHILCWERPGFFLLFALVLDVIAESSIEARCLCRWHKAPALWRNDNVEASLSAPSVGLELSQLRFCTSQIKSSVHVPKENKENKILKITEICWFGIHGSPVLQIHMIHDAQEPWIAMGKEAIEASHLSDTPFQLCDLRIAPDPGNTQLLLFQFVSSSSETKRPTTLWKPSKIWATCLQIEFSRPTKS